MNVIQVKNFHLPNDLLCETFAADSLAGEPFVSAHLLVRAAKVDVKGNFANSFPIRDLRCYGSRNLSFDIRPSTRFARD